MTQDDKKKQQHMGFGTHLKILAVLSDSKSPMVTAQLRQIINTRTQNITTPLRHMAKHGWIERSAILNKKGLASTRYKYTITESGRKALKERHALNRHVAPPPPPPPPKPISMPANVIAQALRSIPATKP
jgi:DNA-binding MarR family transcriptional regulator